MKKGEIVSHATRFVLFYRYIFQSHIFPRNVTVSVIISSVRKIDYTRVICIYGLYGNINYRLVTRFAYSYRDAFEASGILKRGGGKKRKEKEYFEK